MGKKKKGASASFFAIVELVKQTQKDVVSGAFFCFHSHRY